MIGIRADANKEIATGHVMRCMTIADEIKKLGEDVLFFVADNEAVEMITARGFQVKVLASDWKNPVEEIDRLAEEILAQNITTMLFDSYSFTASYFEKLRGKIGSDIKLAVMDDLCKEQYPVDIVVNYNAYWESFGYSEKYSDDTRCLLGLMYAPLRPQFAETEERKTPNFPLRVLIASGGGDNCNILQELIREIVNRKNLADYDFNVIVGKFAECKDEMERIIWCSHNIFRYDNVTEMAKLMSECDIAVSASGTMLSELCAMHVPTVNYIIADNQKYNGEFFGDRGLMINCGDVRADVKAAAARILDKVEELAEDKHKRIDMRNKLAGLCDGRGAERLAKVLCNLE